VKPVHGIAIYVLIIAGIPLLAIFLFLASPNKPAMLRVDGRNMGAVTLTVTLHDDDQSWSRTMSAGRRKTWWPISLRQWDTVTVRCGGDPREQIFDVPGGRATLLTVTTAACAYVEVEAEPY
jgi:hypothetical protein